MSIFFANITAFFEAIPDRVKCFRGIIWILFIILTAIAIAGLGRVDLDNSVNSMIQFFKQKRLVKSMV